MTAGSANWVAEPSPFQVQLVIAGLDPVIHDPGDTYPGGGGCVDGRIKSGNDD